ncbi:MAG: alpha/beta hydrolase [Saccharolobus sp.]
MPLDPRIKKLLESTLVLPIGKMPLDEIRKAFRQLSSYSPKMEVGRIENIKIPGSENNIGARVYFPKNKGPYGILVYFHGGGFVLGDVESYDPVCRAITNACNCVVVSVDYRLAPEHKFPAAVVDAFDATKWVYENADKFEGKMGVAVGGDSAGGNLAAVVAILSKGKLNLKYQILIYPAVGFDSVSKSMIEFSDGFFLTREHIEWFGSQYLNNPSEVLDIRFSPILAQDLTGLPPALIITAEYDPLRDQGEAYANKLLQAGVPVTSVRFNNVTHGFFSFFIVQSMDAIGLVGQVLRRTFYNSF